MPDPVYAGLAATSASPAASTTVVAAFDSFTLTRSGNTGPFVDAGPPQTGGLLATLTGVATDDSAAPAVLWEMLSGPGDITFPSTASGTAAFTIPGTYSVRLFAGDGAVRTFDDTSIIVVSPFTEWQTAHFGPGADPLSAGPRTDPDFDGLENLAEYVLGSDPLAPDASAAPVSSRTATTLSMTWRQSTAASGVIVQPQWSSGLTSWDSALLTIETVSTGPDWIEKRATLDITAQPRAGLQLLITLP